MPEPDMSVWTGRVDTADGPNALRWHQMVKPLAAASPPGIVLVGFACDEGVRRNGGRVGAKDGPLAIRKSLANLAWHQQLPVYDAGDVRCDDGDMENAQERLGIALYRMIRAEHRPIVLGGGHETAFSTFLGIVLAWRDAKVGVINIDAHLDLRADIPRNSGTPFAQMANWYEGREPPFHYLCLGTAVASNTSALFDRAAALGATYVPDFAFEPEVRERITTHVIQFIESVDIIHLSLDLDVLPAAVMPAVSAPAGLGIPLGWVSFLLGLILRCGKTVAVDVVELNPTLDTDGNSARVAARLTWDIAYWWTRTRENLT